MTIWSNRRYAAVLLAISACKTVPTGSNLTADSATSHLSTLASIADYESLMRNDATSQRTYVKITVDHKVEGLPVYFQNTAKYAFHNTFLTAEIPRFQGRSFTMDEILFGETKEISGGAIYWAPDVQIAGLAGPGVLGFEIYFQNAASINIDEIETVYRRLQEQAPFGASRIAYLFSNAAQFFANKTKLDERHIPSGRISQVVGQGATTTVYSEGKSYGFLKAIKAADLAVGDYTSKDILVVDEVPLDIGPLSGIITTEPQVPHSHVIFRAVNQKIPDVYLPNGLNLDLVTKHLGKLVEIESKLPNVLTIKGAADVQDLEAKAAAYFATRIPDLPDLVADLTNGELLRWQNKELKRSMVASYGTKAVNFAIIDKATRAAGFDRRIYEGAFLIPLRYYSEHIGQKLTDKMCKGANKDCLEGFAANDCQVAFSACAESVSGGASVKAFLAAMVEPAHATKMISRNSYRRAYLAFAQGLIKKADVDESLLKKISDEIRKTYTDDVRIRLRSSTNAEDLPGLNGAGFYVSASACLGDSIGSENDASKCMTAKEKLRLEARIAKLQSQDPVLYKDLIAELQSDLVKRSPLAKAVRKVYASVWTEKAFLNRDYYRLNHMDVAMAMLAHPSYSDELANGVIVATSAGGNLEVNVVGQVDDISITNPEIPGATPDQVVVVRSADGSQSIPRFILKSNQTGGQPVLTPGQLTELVEQVAVAVKGLKAIYGESYGDRMDIEFKVDGDGKVHMKQGRPL